MERLLKSILFVYLVILVSTFIFAVIYLTGHYLFHLF